MQARGKRGSRGARAVLALLLALGAAGCVRREGRNADCRWPGEPGATALDPNQFAGARHLSADAEFAEDLAIRYADAHNGPPSRDFAAYTKARNQCLAKMLEEVGSAHGLTAGQVSGALGRNRAAVDLAVNLPFILLYGLAAGLTVRCIWARYPPADGWTAGILVVLFCSLAFAVAGVLLGEFWSTTAENLRVGTGHLSYRLGRLPWSRYRGELFTTLLVLFWLIAARIGWRSRPAATRALFFP